MVAFDDYNWSNLLMRTKFLKENAAQVDEEARGVRAPVTARGMYWRLACVAGVTEATVRDLAECAIVAPDQSERLEAARELLSQAESLLRECYDTAPSRPPTDAT
jgi:protein involved in temperature-dependent protein secretion